MANPHKVRFFLFFCLFLVTANSNYVSIQNDHEHDQISHHEPEPKVSSGYFNDPQEALLLKLEELVRNLSEVVSRLETKLSESSKVDAGISSDSSGSGFGKKDEMGLGKYDGRTKNQEVEAKDGEIGRSLSVTKYSPLWSERFQFMSAVKLGSAATCINFLPFRDYEGLSKYVAVGDDRGRVYLFLRNGDIMVKFCTEHESPIMAMVSYMSVYKNESFVVTGHQNGVISMHRVFERFNGEELSSLVMETVGKFAAAESGEDGLPITTLEVHHVGRMRYVLSTDLSGKIQVFRENGILYGSAMPRSRPLVFLKQRLLFLTETGAGSLDLRSMKIKESECDGLNHSLARNYVFDATDRSKAYGFTSDGDLIHVLLLGDVTNFKCRVRSKKKLEMHEPLVFQAIKGYLIIVDPEKVFVFNISTPHYVRAGVARFLFSASLDEISSSFLTNHVMDTNKERGQVIPVIASDHEKLVVLGLGGEYVGMYHSNLPVLKTESNTMLWTTPVLFFILFLFGAWQFFAKKKDALTLWGPDDPFNSTSSSATNGAPLGSNTGDRPFIDSSSRNSDIPDLRSSGLRGRRYTSPSRYPAAATTSFRPNSADSISRPSSVDPNYRAAPELNYRVSADPISRPSSIDPNYRAAPETNYRVSADPISRPSSVDPNFRAAPELNYRVSADPISRPSSVDPNYRAAPEPNYRVSADPISRPSSVDPNFRAAPAPAPAAELKYRVSTLEPPPGFSKRRESLFANTQVSDENS